MALNLDSVERRFFCLTMMRSMSHFGLFRPFQKLWQLRSPRCARLRHPD